MRFLISTYTYAGISVLPLTQHVSAVQICSMSWYGMGMPPQLQVTVALSFLKLKLESFKPIIRKKSGWAILATWSRSFTGHRLRSYRFKVTNPCDQRLPILHPTCFNCSPDSVNCRGSYFLMNEILIFKNWILSNLLPPPLPVLSPLMISGSFTWKTDAKHILLSLGFLLLLSIYLNQSQTSS